jgi:hypothetical protein
MWVVGVIMMHVFGLVAATGVSTFWLPGPFCVGEYALVYRAGLSNEVRPFKLRLWDKSYNFAHGILQIKNSEAHVALGHSNWKTRIHHKKVFAEKWVRTKKMPSRDDRRRGFEARTR